MNISDYNFSVGDEVVTIYGQKGKIVYICKCDRCEKRGFCEPIWKEDGTDEEHYISNYQAESGFPNFYRIGEHRFNEFNKAAVQTELSKYEEVVNYLKKQLDEIEKIEGDNNEKTQTKCY
jgi:hypothetical protein